MFMDNLDQIVSEAQSAFAAISDPDALEQVKARFLGKSGQITELLKALGKLPPEEKKTAGAAINVAKTAVEAALNERREAIRKAALEARLAEEALDVTLPGRAEARGGFWRLQRLFQSPATSCPGQGRRGSRWLGRPGRVHHPFCPGSRSQHDLR